MNDIARMRIAIPVSIPQEPRIVHSSFTLAFCLSPEIKDTFVSAFSHHARRPTLKNTVMNSLPANLMLLPLALHGASDSMCAKIFRQ
jgi:hypothetical protein